MQYLVIVNGLQENCHTYTMLRNGWSYFFFVYAAYQFIASLYNVSNFSFSYKIPFVTNESFVGLF